LETQLARIEGGGRREEWPFGEPLARALKRQDFAGNCAPWPRPGGKINLGFMNWFLHFFLDLTFCICKTGLGHQAKYRMSIWAQRNDMGPCYQHWGFRQGLGRGQRVKAQV
jgi:hypothetical protein